MRETISAVNAPSEKVAKWLVKEFQNMRKKLISRSVANGLEFINKLRTSGSIEDDEIMVSFDVSALFPSVPLKEAINLLGDWLYSQKGGSNWKLKISNFRTMIK